MYHAPIISAARSHRGLVRPINEDAVLARDDLGLWAVADGAGAYDHGGWASANLCDALAKQAERTAGHRLSLDRAIAANGNPAVGHDAPIATTVAAVHLEDDMLSGIRVGHSRIYRLRDGQLVQLSRGDAAIWELADRGAIAPETTRLYPAGYSGPTAMPVSGDPRTGSFNARIEEGDVYLLCSDGLTAVLPEADIADRLGGCHAAAAADMLLIDAINAGAPDNISLVVIAIGEGAD